MHFQILSTPPKEQIVDMPFHCGDDRDTTRTLKYLMPDWIKI